MRALYFDCFSGAAGDMILGALLDAGASEDEVRRSLGGLGLEGWSLEVSQVRRGSLRATRAEVTTEEDGAERSFSEIVQILEQASLPTSVKERALTVFEVLGEAEAKVHGTSIEKIHFHEVGGLDAIVDVVGCCTALDGFSPAYIGTSPIATGTAMIDGAHGPLPIPAPAVTEILQTCGAALVARGDRELITPTAAALLAVVTDSFDSMPSMVLEGSGYGAGAAELEVPNVLRVLTGELVEEEGAEPGRDDALLIETNLDDMTPELVPHIVDSVIAAGAFDAWTTPITMKKGRPGFMISVLVPPMNRWHVMEILFRETTTLGMRVTSVQRAVADRHWIEVEVAGQPIRVKIGSRHGDVISTSPEYQDILAAAKATGLPLKELYARAMREAAGAGS